MIWNDNVLMCSMRGQVKLLVKDSLVKDQMESNVKTVKKVGSLNKDILEADSIISRL